MILDDFRDFVSSFAEEKPILFKVILFFVALFLIGMIIIYIQAMPQKVQAANKETQIILNHKPLFPEEPVFEKDYYYWRDKKNAWTEEEAKKYFSEPDAQMIDELKKSNDNIINEILGANP